MNQLEGARRNLEDQAELDPGPGRAVWAKLIKPTSHPKRSVGRQHECWLVFYHRLRVSEHRYCFLMQE